MKNTVKKTITMFLALTLAANGMIFSSTAAETTEKVSLEYAEGVIDDIGDILDVHTDNFEEFAANVEKAQKIVDTLSDDEKSSLRNFQDYQMAVDYCESYRIALEYLKRCEDISYTCGTDEETGQPTLKLNSDYFPVAMKMDAGVYEASAGDTIKMTVKVSDVKENTGAVLSKLIYDTDVFEFVSAKPGSGFNKRQIKFTVNPLPREDYKTGCITITHDELETGSIEPGEECDLVEIEIKIKDDVKDGEYALPFFLRSEKSLPASKKPYVWRESNMGVDYYGGLVKVGEGNKDSEGLLYPPYKNYFYDDVEYANSKEEYMEVLAERLKKNSGEISEEDASLGDVNCNGVVDITDISALSIALADKKTLEGQSFNNADVNKDGELNVVDLAALRQFVSKKITRFYVS